MSNLTGEFTKLFKKEVPDSKMLIPLMIWISGSQSNIELADKINKKLTIGNHKIYILELTYNSNINRFLRYPKIDKLKDDEKQYRLDFAKCLGWSQRELNKNINVIDLDSSKEEIAGLFGYENDTRKKLGLGKIR